MHSLARILCRSPRYFVVSYIPSLLHMKVGCGIFFPRNAFGNLPSGKYQSLKHSS